ncbi:MAG TPA: phytanoyl-CoA dioxygenase family protein [Myxococcales bacterium]|nr:phytanoyl-CoA dioxygenase family protein [Myxococcales bacterium]
MAPERLTGAERSHLHTEGWVRLEQVLSTAEVRAMNAAWDGWVGQVGPEKVGNNWGPEHLEAEEAFGPCLRQPRVADAVRELLGEKSQFLSLHGRAPPQGHGQQGLHVDWSTPVKPGEHLLANCFFALDDMDASNGATRVVPRSHRTGKVPRGAPAQPRGHQPGEIHLAARAGDVLVFSSHLWHSGALNASGARRRVVIGQYAVPGLRMPGMAME